MLALLSLARLLVLKCDCYIKKSEGPTNMHVMMHTRAFKKKTIENKD